MSQKHDSARCTTGSRSEKSVLLLTSSFYPSNASGAHRPYAFAKYLRESGWEPTVVCRHFTAKNSPYYDSRLAQMEDPCQVVRVNSFSNKYLTKFEAWLWSVLGGAEHDYRHQYLLYWGMLAASRTLLTGRKFDAIWSTFRPGVCHLVASKLAREFSLPWVADFRDLPCQSENNRFTRFAVAQEARVCSVASALVSTSPVLSEKLRSRHDCRVETVTNGYMPDELELATASREYDHDFTINHFGWLYRYRNPQALFEALDILLDENEEQVLRCVKVNFYGANRALVNSFISGYRCKSVVSIPERIAYHEVASKQASSQVLMLVAPPEQGGAIPAKLFSYLAAQRPVINVPGDGGATDEIVRSTRCGFTSDCPGAIASWIREALNEWALLGKVKYDADQDVVKTFSRKTQSKAIGRLLDQVYSEKKASR